jgi:ABC-type amino acid transport substrate-binding protein
MTDKVLMRRRHLLAALPLFATGLIKASAAGAASVLRVGAALPDPPFEFNAKDGAAGFDITLMQRIAGMIGREWQLVPYKGTDFNGIFAGLDDGSYDCIASGTTITPERSKVADSVHPMRSLASRSLPMSADIRTYMASATSEAW